MKTLLLAMALLAPALAADTFNVINNADSGPGSLRRAIIDANALAGPHTIQFTSAIGSNRTINLQTALPDITEEVTIIGLPSNDIIVRRGVTAVHFRIFTTTTSLELRHLWIMDGSVQAAAGADAAGGAIHATGALTLRECVVSGATARGGDAVTGDGGWARGGAIFCSNTLTMVDSYAGDSTARGGDTSDGTAFGGSAVGGVAYVGGAFLATRSSLENGVARSGANSATPANAGSVNASGATVFASVAMLDSHIGGCTCLEGGPTTVTNGFALALDGSGLLRRCSVTGNQGGAIILNADVNLENVTVSGNTGPGIAGVRVLAPTTVSFHYCTVYNNSGTLTGGVAQVTGTVEMEGTIVAGNSGTVPDVSGSFLDLGDNLIGDASGASGFTTSMLVGDSFSPVPAGLRPLANFGYTRGHVPMWGSFAQDRGSSNAPYDDQRGANRLFGGTPDIGAVEAIDNQAPSFSGGGSVTVKPKGKQVVVAGWATNISAGASWEQGQQLQFLLVGSRYGFKQGPSIDPATGDLSFTPHKDESGTWYFDVYLVDDGGGNDTSTPRLLVIHLDRDDNNDDEHDCVARSGARGLPLAILLLLAAILARNARLKARTRV